MNNISKYIVLGIVGLFLVNLLFVHGSFAAFMVLLAIGLYLHSMSPTVLPALFDKTKELFNTLFQK